MGLFIKAIQGAMEEDMPTPRDEMGKRRLLRWLMNIRMPDEVVRVQDEYLAEPGQVHLHRR